MDAPYGLGVANWDVTPTKEDLEATIAQFMPHNTAKAHVFVVMCHYLQKSMFHHVMVEKGYQDIHAAFWQKVNINVPGTFQYTFGCEELLVGYYGGRRSNVWNTPQDPMQRLNTIFGPALRFKCLKPDNEPVNTCEKPPYICRIYAKHHVSPGNHVLVLGAGAGGDVLGALAAGCNVTAIERDPEQYPHLCSRLQRIASELHDAEEQQKSWIDVLPLSSAGLTGFPTQLHALFATPWKFDTQAAVVEQVEQVPKVKPQASASSSSKPSSGSKKGGPETKESEEPNKSCNQCGETCGDDAAKCSKCGGTYCAKCYNGESPFTCKICVITK